MRRCSLKALPGIAWSHVKLAWLQRALHNTLCMIAPYGQLLLAEPQAVVSHSRGTCPAPAVHMGTCPAPAAAPVHGPRSGHDACCMWRDGRMSVEYVLRLACWNGRDFLHSSLKRSDWRMAATFATLHGLKVRQCRAYSSSNNPL
jgi:hypothetical protein